MDQISTMFSRLCKKHIKSSKSLDLRNAADENGYLATRISTKINIYNWNSIYVIQFFVELCDALKMLYLEFKTKRIYFLPHVRHFYFVSKIGGKCVVRIYSKRILKNLFYARISKAHILLDNAMEWRSCDERYWNVPRAHVIAFTMRFYHLYIQCASI